MQKNYSPKKAAHLAAIKRSAHGVSKKDAKKYTIRSIGTEIVTKQALKGFFTWRQKSGKKSKPTFDDAKQYLEFRSHRICQVSLNRERIALQLYFGSSFTFKFYFSKVPLKDVAPRRYTYGQVSALLMNVNERLATSILLSLTSGARASELLTIAPADEQAESRRNWREDRFLLMDDCKAYTVIGKGGLIRTVMVPLWLALKLETYRRPEPLKKKDRGINRLSLYNIPGGSNFSHRFPEAARKIWGFSNGAHGLRCTYAQTRLSALVKTGVAFEIARLIVSQELGHFSPTNIRYYLPGSCFYEFLIKGGGCDLKIHDRKELMEKAKENWNALVNASILQ